jgi:hypothetical protein
MVSVGLGERLGDRVGEGVFEGFIVATGETEMGIVSVGFGIVDVA